MNAITMEAEASEKFRGFLSPKVGSTTIHFIGRGRVKVVRIGRGKLDTTVIEREGA